MSTHLHKNPRRVLFVDDEPAFLEVIGQAMEAYSAGAWEVLLAPTTSKALAILQQKPAHLIVVDIHMPVVDGIQFLKLLQRKYPHIPRAVLTGDASEEHRDACQANGVEMVLEKPRCPEGLEIVFATLDELAKWQPESGFQGVLRRVGIQDVLQMECLARSSVILEISANGETGQVFIEQGSIVHAQVADLSGEDAFNRLLGFTGGQFNLKGFSEPPARTISGSWEFLLMEAARMRDELMGANPPPEEQAAEPEAPAPAAQETYSDDQTQFFEAPHPAETAEAQPDLQPAQEEFEAAAPQEQTPPAPPSVEEFLIVGNKGEIVHCWQCMAPSEAVQFMNFVRQKAKQVCQGLPVGTFERLELEGMESRLIVRVDEEQSFLLKVNREKPGVQLSTAAA